MSNTMLPILLLVHQGIYADFFRFTQWDSPNPSTFNVDWMTGNGDCNITYAQFTDFSQSNMFDLRYCNYQKDLFHGVMPNAQFGDTAAVPLSGGSGSSVYRELCVSRHFLSFCCNGDYKQCATELYVRKIEDFYNYLERMKLARWYEEQQVYFEKDYALGEDMIFFYDNVNLDPEEIKNSLAYQKYEIETISKSKGRQEFLVCPPTESDYYLPGPLS